LNTAKSVEDLNRGEKLNMRIHRKSAAHRWFVLALVLGGLFAILTAIYATHILDMPILAVESWLLNRPIGGVDCVFFEWRHVGEAPTSLVLVPILGVICWRIGYNWKIIPVLIVLLLMCLGIEYVGKSVFTIYLPQYLHSAMTDLSCSQIYRKPIPVRLEVALGLWWKFPAPIAGQVRWVRAIAQIPVASMPASPFTDTLSSYPGGHAARWCFLSLIASWLCWKHVRNRIGRMVLTILLFIMAFLGGLMQFYIGVHTLADTIAGYLLGAAAACCGIGFLNVLDTNKAALNKALRDANGNSEVTASSITVT
jgi:membrane-associated phospholipid phosphatase